MTVDLTDVLDDSLERLRGGEPVSTILARYPAQAGALTPLLSAATVLETIPPVEVPAPEALLADRNDFLAEITRLQLQPVSRGPFVRLKEWIAHYMPLPLPSPVYQRKEQRRMSTMLVKATLVLTMIFGSAGGATALAANSLPDSPLYPAKLAMEQMRLNMASDLGDQAALHMELAGVRVREMERVTLAGNVPDEATLARLQLHLNQALSLAAQMPDDAMLGLLNQFRHMVQTQEQVLAQAQAGAAEPAQEPLRQATRMLNQVGRELEAGLRDPNTIRQRDTESRPPDAPIQPTVNPPGPPITHTHPISAPQGPVMPGGNPDAPCDGCEPVGDQHQYGPGGNPDAPCYGCEPGGDQNQYGPLPEPPGAGEPGGNPDAPCDGCEPVGDQNQYGPQPESPGPGEPGGNPDAPCDGCEPEGDQNQYGPQLESPGPGEPGGNPDGPCDGCEPEGDENHNGQPSEPPSQNSAGDTDPSPPSDPNDEGGDQGAEVGGNNH